MKFTILNTLTNELLKSPFFNKDLWENNIINKFSIDLSNLIFNKFKLKENQKIYSEIDYNLDLYIYDSIIIEYILKSEYINVKKIKEYLISNEKNNIIHLIKDLLNEYKDNKYFIENELSIIFKILFSYYDLENFSNIKKYLISINIENILINNNEFNLINNNKDLYKFLTNMKNYNDTNI